MCILGIDDLGRGASEIGKSAEQSLHGGFNTALAFMSLACRRGTGHSFLVFVVDLLEKITLRQFWC